MTIADSEAFQRLQNMACRSILIVDSYAHTDDMHESPNISTLYQRQCQHLCNIMHTLLNGNGPPECIDLFRYISEIHHIPTRNALGDLLYIPQTRLKTSERDFAVEGPKLWNQVPLAIRQLESHDQFKALIKTVNFK